MPTVYLALTGFYVLTCYLNIDLKTFIAWPIRMANSVILCSIHHTLSIQFD